MTHGSLFSGIGGFDLAARWMGWTNAFHVERDPFCRQVLAHHFPESQSFDDVKTFDATKFRGRLSILSGGFPCQPFSAAGKRAGTSDDRYLWPEMFRIIREARPTYVVAENVRGLLSWNDGMVLDTVCSDLEGEGYEVLPVVLPAASVNAPHRRDRIWIVAYSVSAGAGREGGEISHKGRRTGEDRGEGLRQTHGQTVSGRSSRASADATNANGEQLEPWHKQGAPARSALPQVGAEPFNGPRGWEEFPTVAPICGGDDGLSKRLDGITFPKWRRESIKAYGNAIVPQVAYQIFQALHE